LRTGHEEIREVQIAFGGGSSAGAAGEGEVRVMSLDFSSGLLGRRTTVRASSGKRATMAARTDLQRLVSAIEEAHKGVAAAPLRQPWLPPLGTLYPLGDVTAMPLTPE